MRFRRKNIRLPSINYRGRSWFCITLCCEGRRPVFLDEEQARWVIDCLKRAAEKNQFAVHAFSVMPDHVHALVEGLASESDLLLFVRMLKQRTSVEYRKLIGRVLWQKKFYDHILRTRDSPEAVSWCIWMNPVQKGLSKSFEEYPFSGSFTRHWKTASETQVWVPPWKNIQMLA
jgi:putative transposase